METIADDPTTAPAAGSEQEMPTYGDVPPPAKSDPPPAATPSPVGNLWTLNPDLRLDAGKHTMADGTVLIFRQGEPTEVPASETSTLAEWTYPIGARFEANPEPNAFPAMRRVPATAAPVVVPYMADHAT